MAFRSILTLNGAGKSRARSETARAYDQVGVKYLAYADGTAHDLFDFGGRYSYGDRRIWATIEAKLVAMAEARVETLRILDVGCGPGTWLRRVVIRAHALGIPRIESRGFDISGEQVAIARMLSADLRRLHGVELRFDHGDAMAALPEVDGSVDLCLCLNAVLNHVEVRHHEKVASELSRVTGGYLVATVRAAGSLPSIFVEGVESARQFYQDNEADRLEIDLYDGRHIEFPSHLFRASELRDMFSRHIDIINLCGLDLFHSRFSPDPRWNPTEGPEEAGFHLDLEQLERTYSTDPHFIDHATHLLMVCGPSSISER